MAVLVVRGALIKVACAMMVITVVLPHHALHVLLGNPALEGPLKIILLIVILNQCVRHVEWENILLQAGLHVGLVVQDNILLQVLGRVGLVGQDNILLQVLGHAGLVRQDNILPRVRGHVGLAGRDLGLVQVQAPARNVQRASILLQVHQRAHHVGRGLGLPQAQDRARHVRQILAAPAVSAVWRLLVTATLGIQVRVEVRARLAWQESIRICLELHFAQIVSLVHSPAM
jgi:hypothetical protein